MGGRGGDVDMSGLNCGHNGGAFYVDITGARGACRLWTGLNEQERLIVSDRGMDGGIGHTHHPVFIP